MRRLLNEGHHVTVFDDVSTGQWSNLHDVAAHPSLHCVEHDVTHPLPPVDACDEVFNLASPASPARYQQNPTRTTLTAVGTWHALALAQNTGARFLQASTSEVYGDPDEHPQSEAYRGSVNPVGPRACYDEGKRCAETLVADAARQFGQSVRIARIFNTYGPGMALDDGRLVVTLLRQGVTGEPLTVFGDGTQTRSLCYLDDMVDGLLALMALPTDPDGPVNLGNPEEHTVLEVAQAVSRLVPGSTVSYAPLPVDDPKRRCPDVTKARSLWGFDPKVSLQEGLRRTLDDVRQRLVVS